jgi:aminoglycoside phosphotransferase (APT) family kinase protein
VTATFDPANDVSPPPAAEVGAALQRYLAAREPELHVAACERISGGFETFIFGVRLERDGTRPAGGPPSGRVILRLYRGPAVVERSSWEAATIRRVRAAGVPAPELYLHEADPAPLGAPFLLLERLRGRRLDEAGLSAKPIAVLRLLRNFARAQAAIHTIDWPEGRERLRRAYEVDTGPLSWRPDRLAAARADLQARGIDALLSVVDWLEERQDLLDPADDVFIHGDFHPLNVFVDGTEVSGIIDWAGCGFANKHEDVGWTGMLIATVTAADKKEDRHLAPFRTVAYRVYQAAIWRACRLNRTQLRYGEVYGALRWLLIFLPSYLPNAGPPVLNDDAPAFTTPLYVRRVRRFIEKRTKLKLAIE